MRMGTHIAKPRSSISKIVSSVPSQVHHDKDICQQLDLPGIADNPVLNKDALPEGARDRRGSIRRAIDGVKNTASSAAHFIAHPKSTIKEKATTQVTVEGQPWAEDSNKMNTELLDAHDRLDDLWYLADSGRHVEMNDISGLEENRGTDIEHQISQQQRDVDNLEDHHTVLKARWHMDNYVYRARVVRGNAVAVPTREPYKKFDSNNKYDGTDWGRYIGHIVLYHAQPFIAPYIDPSDKVPYDRAVLRAHIERVIVASEPLQLWWMRVRRIYTWEDPWLTARWLIVYLVLLKTGYMMTFYWCYLLYSVIGNRYGIYSRKWMRESNDRARDRAYRASMITELVQRHGKEQWLDPLLDEFGPWIQLQLGDLADFLEISANYYDWRNPPAVWSTCVAYFALALSSAIPDLNFSIKIFWFACGLFFFGSRPIATLHPRYRHVVDPIRWMFWDTPTNSEWTFGFLRNQGRLAVERIESDSRHGRVLAPNGAATKPYSAQDGPLRPPDPQPALRSFHCQWNGEQGLLQLCRASFRFVKGPTVSSDGTGIVWEYPYVSILELRKAKRASRRHFVGPTEALVIIRNDRTEDEVDGMIKARRDEAFSGIVSLSGLVWQHLQPCAEEQERRHHGRDDEDQLDDVQ